MSVPRLLERSRTAYLDYLRNGRTFAAAKVLFAINEQARKELEILDWPDRLQADVRALLMHYESWLRAWAEAVDAFSPKDDDVFAFKNNVTFPKESEKRILEFLQ